MAGRHRRSTRLRSGTPPGGANTLLFALLRHALLRVYARRPVRIVRARGVAAPGEGTSLGWATARPRRMGAPGAPRCRRSPARQTLAEHLDAVRAAAAPPASPAAAQIAELIELQASLRQLAGCRPRHWRGSPPECSTSRSHRLDAWVSAQATRRLAALRAGAAGLGARLGGYGVLEDVRPSPPPSRCRTATFTRPRSVRRRPPRCCAPGTWPTRRARQPLALDLSSRRVRLALGLLDGVRAGQPLGALLGYRLERGLHEDHRELVLDRYIAPLRGARAAGSADRKPSTSSGVPRRRARSRRTRSACWSTAGRTARRDRATKDQLRAALAAAQADLTAAEAAAGAASNRLEARQAELQELLDEAATGAPRLPPWKIGGDTIPEAGMTPAMRARLNTLTREVRTLAASVDSANGQAAAIGVRVTTLNAQLSTANPEISRLEQAITELQPELEAARAAVAAARARAEELRGQAPEISEAVRANNVVDGLALRQRWRTGVANARWDVTTIPFGDAATGLPALGTAEQKAIESRVARAGRCGGCARGFAARRGRAPDRPRQPREGRRQRRRPLARRCAAARRRRRPHAPRGHRRDTSSVRAARSVIARGGLADRCHAGERRGGAGA